MKKIASFLLAMMLLAGCSASRSSSDSAAAKSDSAGAKPGGAPAGMKPYIQVITKEAKSDTGLFIVHRIKEKLFFEIPKKELKTEFLLVSTQAKVSEGMGYGGDAVNQQVVMWERVGDRILLRSILYGATAADSLPIAFAVKKANLPAIIMAFDIAALNKDSSHAVIDVTDLFVTDVAEMGMAKFTRQSLQVKRLDSKRSFIEFSKTFPTNIETEATLTYDAGVVPGASSLSSISMTMHHSMVRLPEKPMMPRLQDNRIGFFSYSQFDYGYEAQRAEPRQYIARWRLEPKDPDAIKRGELSDPIKPITFYIDRGVPDKWRPWLKKGVQDWQVAFEKAGFRKAIIAIDAPRSLSE